MRLNKYVAHYSTYSRREADETIQLGFVKVNNVVQNDPAYDVLEEDVVTLKGKILSPTEIFTVIVYNKNRGEIVTKKDEKGRKTIYDTLDKKFRHFIPVGRLDFASEGVLLLTDSSVIADALMTSNWERVYKIKIKGSITPAMLQAMQEGIHIADATQGAHEESSIQSMTFAPFAGYQIVKDTPLFSILKVSIIEGQNRELRRFFGAFDREVVDLKRLAYGPFHLNALPNGKTRFLTRREYSDLRSYLKQLEKAKKERAKPVVETEERPKKEGKKAPTKPAPKAKKSSAELSVQKRISPPKQK